MPRQIERAGSRPIVSLLSEMRCMGFSYDAVLVNQNDLSSIGQSMTSGASQNWKIPHCGARHCHQIPLVRTSLHFLVSSFRSFSQAQARGGTILIWSSADP